METGHTLRTPPHRTFRLTPAETRQLIGTLERLAVDGKLSPTLTTRFVELAMGFTYREIAASHHLTVNTVKTEVSAVLRRLGVRSRYEIELVAKEIAYGVHDEIGPDEIYRVAKNRFLSVFFHISP